MKDLRVLRAHQVYGPEGRSGLSRSECYRQIERGTFPAGFKLGRNSRGWLAQDIDAWIAEKMKQPPVEFPEYLARGQAKAKAAKAAKQQAGA